jgi:hypothetical protein
MNINISPSEALGDKKKCSFTNEKLNSGIQYHTLVTFIQVL